ncbi:MAG: chemotaxis protein CheC [Agathobaculum sp.]|uniref:chemotaxis protein CheC n=1 Tax=Agathobaculum sp. TaxID=2048138 RepID=UPI0025BE98D5|nr:chemotaxis protein CheC [Agathobaculum sp.]MCI7124696.1 chemotaxis protein CheC [Agathobaculum sp.]MDY3712284.1 chemotaxis protein CheC [Agathobaculum sp.]
MVLRKYEEINSMQIDALREIGSIGTGNAATALSALLGCEVRIPLPEVQILEFNAAVEKLGGFETVSAGIISSLSGEINGLMLALLQLDAVNLFLGRMMGKSISDYSEMGELEGSAVIEVGNILISSFINALSGLSGVRISPSVPQISIDMQGAIITVPMAAYGSQSDYIMLIGGSFIVEGKQVPCRLLLAPDMRSLNYLLHRLGIDHE